MAMPFKSSTRKDQLKLIRRLRTKKNETNEVFDIDFWKHKVEEGCEKVELLDERKRKEG